MCIIVECLKGRVLPPSVWQNFAKRNDDGAGFMWVDNHGNVKRARLLEKNKSCSPDKIYLMHKTLAREGIPHFVHMRYATHGLVSKDNCHPFEVLPGLMLMHNGVISPGGYGYTNRNYSGFGEGRWLDDDMWPHMRERAGLKAPVTPQQEALDTMVRDAVERMADSMPPKPQQPTELTHYQRTEAALLTGAPPGTTSTPVPPSTPATPVTPTSSAETPDTAATAATATPTVAPPVPVSSTAYEKPVRSDTAIFVEDVLRPHLLKWLETSTVEKMDEYLRSEGFNAQMKRWTGYANKIVMYNKEGAIFFPDNHWVKLDGEKVPGAGGVFVSNSYAWTDEKDYNKAWKQRQKLQGYKTRVKGRINIIELHPQRKKDGTPLSPAEQSYLDNELQMLTLMEFFKSLGDMEEVEREVVACPTEVAQLLMFLIDGSVPHAEAN